MIKSPNDTIAVELKDNLLTVTLNRPTVLNALNINSKLRNLSFLDGKNMISDKIKIKKLEILFKKITK